LTTVDLSEVQRARDEADCVLSASAIEQAVARVAAEVTQRLGRKNPLIYCVMNGGLMFCGQLLRHLDFPLEAAYLHATRYGHSLTGTFLDWRVRPTQDLRGRSVLVIDDILDEGHTLEAIVAHLREEGAAEVLTAVLVDKRHDRKVRPGIRADFTGAEIGDRYLFGCGMDYKGYWRNLPAIYALKGS
jgi:hypoxanthine phosphoribosyltransferase